MILLTEITSRSDGKQMEKWHLVSLVEASRMLDRGPSYVTLKRWAVEGVLSSAIASKGKRPKYRLDKLQSIVEKRRLGGASEGTTLGQETIEQLASGVESRLELLINECIGKMEARLSSKLDEVSRALENLEATRKMLMVNSDAIGSMYKERAKSLEIELRGAQGNSLDLFKLVTAVREVSDKVGALSISLKENGNSKS